MAFSIIIAMSEVVLFGATLGMARLVGGWSLGGSLIGLAAATAAILGGAVLWRAGLARTGMLPALEGSGALFSTIVGGMAAIFAGTIRVGIVLSAATSMLRLPEVDLGNEARELVALSPGPAGIAIFVFAGVILAPVGEEILFRGVVLPWLCRWMSEEAAVWVSAVMFAAAHYRYRQYMLVVVVYGLVLGVARLRTGNLRAAMVLHAIINTVALAVALRDG
jgi:membrane protease YdiL (CAAX protease family)